MKLVLNDTELLDLVKAHCGHKLDRKDHCENCRRMGIQAKIIKWQKNEMWHRYRCGYYTMTEEQQIGYDKQRKEFLNGLRRDAEDRKKARNVQSQPVQKPAV